MELITRKLVKVLTLSFVLSASMAFAENNSGGRGSVIGNATGDGTLGTVVVKPEVFKESKIKQCNGAIGVLRAYKTRYALILQQGNLVGARAMLVKGLHDSLRVFQESASKEMPLTQKAIMRGIDLNNVFSSENGGDEMEQRVAISFLEDYYAFIENVAKFTDVNTYLPYFTRSLSADVFAVNFEKFAKEQISFVLHRASAFGKDSYELQAYERITKWTSDDLNQSLEARKFACLSVELEALSSDLAAFNMGDTMLYGNSKMAVQMTRLSLTSILKNGCVQ